jgi:hypothetical protein
LPKRDVKSAAAKIAVFAYDRETREPLWQSGVAQAGSNARDTWILGIGPIQYGSIYRGTRFAGKRIDAAGLAPEGMRVAEHANGVDHRGQHLFASQLFSGDANKQAANGANPEEPKAVEAAAPGGGTIQR